MDKLIELAEDCLIKFAKQERGNLPSAISSLLNDCILNIEVLITELERRGAEITTNNWNRDKS